MTVGNKSNNVILSLSIESVLDEAAAAIGVCVNMRAASNYNRIIDIHVN